MKYYPEKRKQNLQKLGYNLPRSVFPPEPSPALREQYEQQIEAKVAQSIQMLQDMEAKMIQMKMAQSQPTPQPQQQQQQWGAPSSASSYMNQAAPPVSSSSVSGIHSISFITP